MCVYKHQDLQIFLLNFCFISRSPAAMVVYLDLEYIVFFLAEYCCPDPLFEDSGGCGGVTLGQF